MLNKVESEVELYECRERLGRLPSFKSVPRQIKLLESRDSCQRVKDNVRRHESLARAELIARQIEFLKRCQIAHV